MLRISPVESNTQSNIMEDAFIHIYFAAGKGVKYYDQPVCLSVCLSALLSQKPHVQISPDFLCMLPLTVARSSSDGNGYVMYFRFCG